MPFVQMFALPVWDEGLCTLLCECCDRQNKGGLHYPFLFPKMKAVESSTQPVSETSAVADPMSLAV